MKTLSNHRQHDVHFLLIVSFVFFLLRLPSLIEPYWYGDEGIYQTIGFALRNGRTLYSGIWDNKPPLLYMLYALFNGDQETIRLVSILFGVASVVVVYFLAKKMFRGSHATSITTIAFAVLFSLPLVEGNIANAENFMLLPILLAAYLVYQHENTKYLILNTKYKVLFVAGLLLGIAFLFKIVAVFDLAAFAIFLIFLPFLEEKTKRFSLSLLPLQSLGSLLLGLLFPVLLTFFYFFIQGNLTNFLEANFLQNIRYVGYKNEFLIPQGLLIFKLILLLSFVALLFLKKNTLTKSALFIFLWLAFSVFNAYFSHRPYTHYILVALPSFCLALGLTFSYWKKSLFIPAGFLLTLFLLSRQFDLPDINKYKKPATYYQNFATFLLGQRSVSDFQAFFDNDVPRDYEVARYLKNLPNKNEGIFIWGNSAQMYVLSGTLPPGRYTVAYHIAGDKALSETENVLQKAKTKYVVLMHDAAPYPFSLLEYQQKIRIRDTTIYERVY